MKTTTDLSKLYEMILSLPGMNEEIKMSIKITRKHILFLSKIIEKGMDTEVGEGKGQGDVVLVTPDIKKELQQINQEILQKAGLGEMYAKLSHF